MKIFSGSSNLTLAKEICKYLNKPLGECILKTFSDGEIQFQITENVRGEDIFIIQSTSYEVNFHLMELLIMVDAFKRASAERITAVIPYYGYARQDRKDKPRVPITARLVADLLEAAGVDRVLTMDLHAHQIQGFFSIPVDNLFAAPILCEYLEDLKLKDLVIVSPDAGGVERARMFAKRLNASLAIVDKRRTAPNVAELMNIIGEVENRETVVVDDIVDTAGTLAQTGMALKEKGARRIFAACTHPVLSGKAIERLESSPYEELIITNTIQISDEKKECKKIRILSVANLFGEAIKRIHESSSVSSLFN
jgi:ribose-phosphate pyrophosphokinase